MLDMRYCSKKPDDEEVFYDGFLYIIRRTKEGYLTEDGYVDDEYGIEVKCICPEYDHPITLADISQEYPDVIKVIFEDALKGYVYSYGNHRNEKNAEMWELVGTTHGYA
jgi:hypothetical protein